MIAVVKEKAGPGVTVKKIPVPTPKKGELLIKVKYASICGTDIGIYNWIPWAAEHIKPPIVIGHEVVGEVIDVNGSSGNIAKGDLVSSETHIFCGHCYQCHIGNFHVCENMELFGIGRDGGFAEYAVIPIRTSWKNDKSISPKSMSVQEPLGNAVHVVSKAGVYGKRVLIVGLGPTGLCASAAAKAYGANEIVAVDPVSYRQKLAKKFTDVTTVSNLAKDQYNSFDVVCEMSGHPAGIQTAFDAVRISGKIIAFGIPKTEISINWGKYMINKELTIESVFGRRIWETWYQTQDLLTSAKIDLSKIITHTFKLEDFEKAMAVMKSGECGKVVLKV